MRSLESATSWQDLHEALAEHGMEIKRHGNGLSIKDRHSKKRLTPSRPAPWTGVFLKIWKHGSGAFQSPQDLKHVQERTRYTAEPLHRSPERRQLFAEYQVGIEVRKATLQSVKEQEDAALAAIRAEWATKRRELERKNIAKKNLRRLLQLARKHEAEALARARLSFQEPRNAVRREVPFTSWNSFLQHKAEQGNEVALAVLRSRERPVEPEREASAKDWSRHGQVQAEYAVKEREIFEMDGIDGKGKSRLLAVLRMEQIVQENHLASEKIPHHVDRKGSVVFTLHDGGLIRDKGQEVLFSTHSDSARHAALLYAEEVGKTACSEENRFSSHDARDRSQGMER